MFRRALFNTVTGLPATRRYLSSTASNKATWGFIGLGQMGYPMAKNLRSSLPAGDKLVIYDVNETATKKFVEEVGTDTAIGVTVQVADAARDVAEQSDTVITMLPEPKHVRAVYDSFKSPALSSRSGGRLFIDSSTIDVKTSLEVGDAIASNKLGHFVDAPVSGGVVGARAGTLTFMLGAPQDIVTKVESILIRMGKRVLNCGKPGMGLAGKLANNYLLAINNIGTAEAMNFGIKLGLEPKVLANVINVSTGRCWPSEVNNPVPGVVEGAPSGRDYSGGFGVSLMLKDLKLAIAAAELANAKLVLGDSARAVYDDASTDERCKGKDFSVIYRYLNGEEGNKV